MFKKLLLKLATKYGAEFITEFAVTMLEKNGVKPWEASAIKVLREIEKLVKTINN